MPAMEEPPIGGNSSTEETGGPKESLVVIEVKKQLYLAGPLIAGCLLQQVVQMISIMFVGHLEWWSSELLVLLSGLLPNPKLEASVLSICLNTVSLAIMIPFGLGAAISTRVSNELGAGRPEAARLATRVIMVLGLAMGVSVGLLMVSVRNIWGYAYSNENEVVEYIARMMPLLSVSIIFDNLQCVLSGIVRGCGLQRIGACVNLSAYYLVGIPAALCFAFVFHLGGMGLWLGIICGVVVQMLLLLAITMRTNWDKEALKAKDRVLSSSLPLDMTT
uniref:Protein TRANSPARENT TESTA 12 n=2 Tax=Aegilops tauschii subsp. strangulata TaxID=200361 RepID=A0A453LNK5_AEGTS